MMKIKGISKCVFKITFNCVNFSIHVDIQIFYYARIIKKIYFTILNGDIRDGCIIF